MDNAIVLNFADGTVATAGLVVAADGIHSRIRQHYHVGYLTQIACNATYTKH